ncbi:MAG: DoxX family membrane protein [Anaeromyxobacter sp.]
MTERKPSWNAYWALRLALGVVPIVAGLDKFTNLLADWQGYLSPLAVRLLPFSGSTFMHLAGVVEVAVGVAILTGHARVFGWVAMAWLGAIALNLITTGHFLDVAARDAVMAVAAAALAQLAQLHERAPAARQASPDPRPLGGAGPAASRP